jgi:Flp pilus assembly protein TadD
MKNRKLLFSMLVALMLVFVGCESLQDMLKLANKVEYNVIPRVLEAKGGMVDFELKGNFPEKFFAKTAVLEITPVLKCSNGEEIALESYKVQGEEVVDNNKVISSVTGGSFSHSISIPFEAKMRKAELVVRVNGTMEKESLAFPEIKVADGVKSTSTLAQTDPKTIFIKDQYVQTTKQEFESDIHYQIQRSNVRRSERTSDDMKKFAEMLKELNTNDRKDLKNVEVISYASPDGELALNEKLAKAREKSADKVLKKDIKKNKVELAEGQVSKKQVAEDWDGFKKILEASNIHDRNLILRVLEMYTDPVKREQEIKNIAKAYEEIADDVLPKLRRTRFVINYDLVGKTDDEILAAVANAEELNVEELLHAESLVKANAEKIKINKMVIAKFPKDIRGYNNLAICHINDNDFDKAAEALKSALEVSPSNKKLFNNMAAVLMLKADNEAAANELSKAQNASSEAYYNGAILALKAGDYENATSNFGQWQTYNAALANYLAGNTDRSLDILKALPENGDNLYLTAVVACYKNDTDLMFSSLMKAVQKDAKYKQLAKTDIEFADHFEDDKFKAIVQ